MALKFGVRRRIDASGRQRAAALRFARAGVPEDWNAWRRETDIFGDLLKTRVNLAEVSLRAHDFRGYLLVNVSFYKADLEGAILAETDCAYADFHLANLVGVNLQGANLRSARLSRAYLRGADLSGADLRGCDLRRSSLTGAILLDADVRGVDLSSTRGLTQAQADNAIGDAATRLPEHIRRPDNWDSYDDEIDDEDLANLSSLPATVETIIQGGRVELAVTTGDAAFSSSLDPRRLRAEILASVVRLEPRLSNAGELSRSLRLYAEEIRVEDYDVIILGLRGISLQEVFEEMAKSPRSEDDFDMMDDVKGAMRAVLIQHHLFISQSHKWRAFIEQAAQSPYGPEHKALASQTGQDMAAILESHQTVCDPLVPKAIRRVGDELEIGDDRQSLAVFNAFASQENVLRNIVSWIIRETTRLSQDAWTHFRDDLSKMLERAWPS